MSAFEGVDPVQEEAIRRALKKELRQEVADELRGDIRRKIERDVQDETRSAVLREIAERAPTPAERKRFTSYVDEVRLDAYAQATLASDIADDALADLTRSRKITGPLLSALFVAFPLALFTGARLFDGYRSPAFIATALTAALAYLAVLIQSTRRERRLERESTAHREIASRFLVLAERAKAYAMVHAERLTSSEELHEVLEDLRRAKERQDNGFHPSAHDLEAARERVRPRIAAEDKKRIAIDLPEDRDEEVSPARRDRARR